MTQVLEERYFTKGRIIVRGKTVQRGEAKKADYILFYKPNIPVAVVEAKDNNHSVGAGMQQALDYAETLDVPFAYSSNGDGFIEHDRTGKATVAERDIALEDFPSADQLWSRYRGFKEYTPQQEIVATQDYYSDPSGKTPHYFQQVAINRTVDAIARGENRVLLVMATGTGKIRVFPVNTIRQHRRLDSFAPAQSVSRPSRLSRSLPRARPWLKDESLEDSANLPPPDVIAAEIDSRIPIRSPFGLPVHVVHSRDLHCRGPSSRARPVRENCS